MEARSYKDLQVWEKSIQLVKAIYLVTERFPQSEKFGLVDQLRRAAVSVPSNIAEGYGRNSSKERSQFISVARGSGAEVEAQLTVAKELGFIPADEFTKTEQLVVEVLKMLTGLRKSLA